MGMFWKIVGIFLLSWAAWDIYFGYTYLYDIGYRDRDPGLFWTAVMAWALLGLSCFWSSKRQPAL